MFAFLAKFTFAFFSIAPKTLWEGSFQLQYAVTSLLFSEYLFILFQLLNGPHRHHKDPASSRNRLDIVWTSRTRREQCCPVLRRAAPCPRCCGLQQGVPRHLMYPDWGTFDLTDRWCFCRFVVKNTGLTFTMPPTDVLQPMKQELPSVERSVWEEVSDVLSLLIRRVVVVLTYCFKIGLSKSRIHSISDRFHGNEEREFPLYLSPLLFYLVCLDFLS